MQSNQTIGIESAAEGTGLAGCSGQNLAFYNDQSWLDNGGHPHTDALHLTERFRRRNFGSLELEVTVDDHKAYTKPWKSVTVHFELLPDTELIEFVCQENSKDDPHLRGK